MTLLEVLLTLCLLVILAALTWPGVGRPMARQRLREGADQVRTAWVRARVEAMSSGRLHVFRATPEGNAFQVEAQGEDDSPGATPTGDTAHVAQTHRLPEKVRFAGGQTAADPRAPAAAAGAASGQTSASGGSGQGFTDPVYFFADGTCSTVQVRLQNEYGQTVDLSLRGLTGVVTLGEMHTAEAGAP
jgi:Tfp pilus assembly protein FimT